MASAISNGPNSRPLDETIAETGSGIADDSVSPRESRPEEIGGREIERQAEALRSRGWARRGEDEAEAHPT